MREVRVVAAVIVGGSRVLVARRGPRMSHAGCWEFPGGKVEAGEDDARALERELEEELGIGVRVGPFVGESVHEQPERRIRLAAYLCDLVCGDVVATEHSEIRWVEAEALAGLDWAPADGPLLDAVRRAMADPS